MYRGHARCHPVLMRRRALVAAVVGWTTVVGATSAVAWVAIDRAGREVLTAPSSGLVDAGGVATGTPRTPVATAPRTAPTSARTPTTDDGERTSPPASTTSRTSTSSRSSAPSPASSTRTTRTAPAPSAVDRTVRVEGGQVGVRCVGRTASLRFAQPADGWSVRVEDNGPEQVKVTFSSSGERRDIEVEAQCSNGTPVFSTSDDEHDRSEESND